MLNVYRTAELRFAERPSYTSASWFFRALAATQVWNAPDLDIRSVTLNGNFEQLVAAWRTLDPAAGPGVVVDLRWSGQESQVATPSLNLTSLMRQLPGVEIPDFTFVVGFPFYSLGSQPWEQMAAVLDDLTLVRTVYVDENPSVVPQQVRRSTDSVELAMTAIGGQVFKTSKCFEAGGATGFAMGLAQDSRLLLLREENQRSN